MPVKKKKVAKKKIKPRMKTAICTENDSHEVFEGYVECPYCGESTSVEGRDIPPPEDECYSCGKRFKIDWQ